MKCKPVLWCYPVMDGDVGHTAWAAEGREGQSQAGPKGRQLEVGPLRGPRLLVILYIRFQNISTHAIIIRQVLRTDFAASRLFAPQSSEKQLHNIHRYWREYCSCQCELN